MEYDDPIEAEFAFEIWAVSVDKLADDRWIEGIELCQIDAFLSSGKWDEVSHAELLGERESAFASYRQGDFDTALLKMRALNRMCQFLGYKQGAHNFVAPLVQKLKKHSKEQADRAAQGGKLDEAKRRRIAKEYWLRKSNGEGYGAAQALAARYNVSKTTIHGIVKKYRTNSIDK